MEKRDQIMEDLERLAALMAQSITDLDCPECCDCGPVYQYMELSARLYQDEWEWACFAQTIVRARTNCQPRKDQPSS